MNRLPRSTNPQPGPLEPGATQRPVTKSGSLCGYKQDPRLLEARQRAVIIAGRPGSGKDICANYLQGFLENVQVVNLGDIVRNQVARSGNVTRSLLQKKSIGLRKKFGADVIAALAIRAVDKSKRYVVFVGIRDIAEVRRVQKMFDTAVIAVYAPPKVRYTRLMERSRLDDTKDLKKLVARDADEDKWSRIDTVMEEADIRLDNSGSLALFKWRVKEVARSLR